MLAGSGLARQPIAGRLTVGTPPANDNFANATRITTSSNSTAAQDNTFATTETSEPGVPSASMTHTQWWKTVTSTVHTATITWSGTGGGTVRVRVYPTTGSTGTFSDLGTAVLNAAGTSSASSTFASSAGTYYIQTGSDNPVTDGVLTWSGLPAIPLNDNFAQAATVSSASGSDPGLDLTYCTTETSEPNSATNTIWYAFTLASSLSTYSFQWQNNAGGTEQHRVYLYKLTGAASFANLTLLANVTSASGTATLDQTSGAGTLTASTYYAKVGYVSGTVSSNSTFSWSGLTTLGGGGTTYSADVTVSTSSSVSTAASNAAVAAVSLPITDAISPTATRAATFVAASKGSTTATSGSFTLTLPTGATTGDVVVFNVITATPGTTIAPAGWTSVRATDNNTAPTYEMAILYRVLQAGDTAPSFTIASKSCFVGYAFRPAAANHTFIVDAHPNATDSTSGTSITAPTASSTGVDVSLLLVGGRAVASGSTAITTTPPAGWTEDATNGDVSTAAGTTTALRQVFAEGCYQLGATNTQTPAAFTLSASSNSSATHVLLKETVLADVTVATTSSVSTGATRATFGNVSMPVTSSVSTDATDTPGGTAWTADVSMAFTSTTSTAAALSAHADVSLPITSAASTTGTRTTFGDVALPLTSSTSTSATRTAVVAASLPITSTTSTTAALSAHADVALPVTWSSSTAGTRATFGDVALPLTWSQASAAVLGAVGNVSLSALFGAAPVATKGLNGDVAIASSWTTVVQVQANIAAVPGQATADLAAPAVVALRLATTSAVPGDATADTAAAAVRGRASVTAVAAQAVADLPVPTVTGGSQVQANVSAVPGQATADLAAPGVTALQLAAVQAVVGQATADLAAPSIAARASIEAVAAQAVADALASTLQIRATVGATPGLAAASIAAAVIAGRALVQALAADAGADVPSPRLRPSRDITLVAVADPRRWSAEFVPSRWAGTADPRRWTST